MEASNAITAFPTTLEEDLVFVRQMLRELRDTAVKHDAMLAGFIQMGYLQSGDILSGKVEANPNDPRAGVKTA